MRKFELTVESLRSRCFQEPNSGCWLWEGYLTKGKWQYGVTKSRKGRGTELVHRAMYELAIGPIPDGMDVLHKCDTPPCCNPEHLFPGTQKDNMQDMVKKHGHWMQRCPGRQSGEQNNAAKLDWITVDAIRAAAAAGVNKSAIARERGLSREQVRDIVLNKRWKVMADA